MIRQEEILPSAPPIRHALKVELFGHKYYYSSGSGNSSTHGRRLQPTTPANGGRTQYVWPATSSDNYCCWPGHPLAYNGTLPALAPGALLAIPRDLAASVKTTTVPGQKIKEALVSYGAYVVDDTAGDSAAVIFEAGSEAKFEQAYNMSIGTSGGAWYDDLLALFQALHVVVNNKNTTVGGGGIPLAPLAPPICGAVSTGSPGHTPLPSACGVLLGPQAQ
jgi:hypothetical protein